MITIKCVSVCVCAICNWFRAHSRNNGGILYQGNTVKGTAEREGVCVCWYVFVCVCVCPQNLILLDRLPRRSFIVVLSSLINKMASYTCDA